MIAGNVVLFWPLALIDTFDMRIVPYDNNDKSDHCENTWPSTHSLSFVFWLLVRRFDDDKIRRRTARKRQRAWYATFRDDRHTLNTNARNNRICFRISATKYNMYVCMMHELHIDRRCIARRSRRAALRQRRQTRFFLRLHRFVCLDLFVYSSIRFVNRGFFSRKLIRSFIGCARVSWSLAQWSTRWLLRL